MSFVCVSDTHQQLSSPLLSPTLVRRGQRRGQSNQPLLFIKDVTADFFPAGHSSLVAAGVAGCFVGGTTSSSSCCRCCCCWSWQRLIQFVSLSNTRSNLIYQLHGAARAVRIDATRSHLNPRCCSAHARTLLCSQKTCMLCTTSCRNDL